MSDHKSTEPWKPIDIPSAKLPNGPTKLHAVIAELDPASAKRYRPDKSKTFCNIFLWDVTRAMGHEVPHWIKRGEKLVELNANANIDWLKEHGPANGWVEADRKTALDAAARGHLVVVGWHSGLPRASGHVAIVLPEGTIAQAGKRNFVGEPLSAGFGNLPVLFFIQSGGGSHAA